MNHDVSNLLLSIVIPTKNRQIYAVAAVESVLRLSARNVEIEVIVRDCSDNNSLCDLLKSKFSDDDRYHYIYDSSKPSMTENWDLAFSEARGHYVCGIGDDDAVLGNILDVVEYMDTNNIDCIRQPMVNYFWPGSFLNTHNYSKLVFPKAMLGSVWLVDTSSFYDAKVEACGFGYTHELPNVYHAIIKTDILREHKAFCGHIFNGTSLDAYSSFAFTKYIKHIAVTDFPFSIHGACPTSNTNRLNQKNKALYKIHFDEFSNLEMPDFLPRLLSSDVSVAESMITALNDTGRQNDIKKINLAYVYGRSAALNLQISFRLYIDYLNHRSLSTFKLGFFSAFFHFLSQRIRQEVIYKSSSAAEYVAPKMWLRFLEKHGNSKRVVCEHISEACDVVEAFLPISIMAPMDASANCGFNKHTI